MREQFIQLGDRRLNHAVSSNDAPAMVMLHGVTRRWQTFLPMWSSLAQRWQLSAIDFRGHGLSDNVNSRYRVCDYTEDVIAYLEAQFDRPVVLYGHSLGAMVAADGDVLHDITLLEDRSRFIAVMQGGIIKAGQLTRTGHSWDNATKMG